MLRKIKHYLKEIAIFFVIITILANAVSLYKSSNLNKEPLKLTNITLLDGKEYILSDDKPTLVHIWATWCPTCKIEASNIQTVSQYYNILTIAVKSGSNSEIQSWMSEGEYNFNVINDTSGLIASEFNIGAYPTTFIYNKNKELVFSDVGYTSTWGLFLRMWYVSL